MNKKPEPPKAELTKSVEEQAERKLKARQNRRHGVWFGLGMFGLVGWSVAIPTLAGIALGVWIDKRWPGQISWTLTLMFVGVVLGCLNAWRWIGEESRDD
ncbi:AtpZ/AtpI family protein [Methylomarinum sp. Ch1-1]|uniref:AtpZ/AtpI family protein n=1 Tax=Methylomarinum roseum TaxID=3067653 RepID=A0AAU7NY19_9GAMM